MVRYLLIILFVFSCYSISIGQAYETVVVGAQVNNSDGLDFGAAGDLEMARYKFMRALRYMPYFARSLLNLQIYNDTDAQIISRRTAIILFRSLNVLDSLQALNLANTAIDENKNYALAYLVRGRNYQRALLFDEALEDYQKGGNLLPDFTLSYYFRGKLYSHLERYGEAISDFTRLLALDDSYAPAYLERGIAFSSLRKFDRAVGLLLERTFQRSAKKLQRCDQFVQCFFGKSPV